MCCKAEGIWKTNASKYQKHLAYRKNICIVIMDLNDKHSFHSASNYPKYMEKKLANILIEIIF